MEQGCAVCQTAKFIGKRWTLLLLLELYKGETRKKRYSELKARLSGITPKLLSQRLRELEKEGLVRKKVDASSFPVRSEYELTESGSDFISAIKCIKKWSIRWKPCSRSCRSKDCKICCL